MATVKDRRQLGFQAAIALILVASIGYIVYYETHDLRNTGWHLLRIAAEPLLVAALLTLTVDSTLKRRLVNDVMELQTKKLWGVNAPPEYATRMGGAVSKIDRIVLYALWIVRIEELDRTKLPSSDHLPAIDAVEVRTELRQQVQNISDVGWEFEDPWIARSLAGFPRSCFTRLELSVERPGGEVGDKTPMVWSADELSAATGDQAVPRLTYSKDGVTYIGIKDLLNSRAKLPPGATASIHQEGCSHQPAIGGLPLVNRMPSLTTTIRIEGSARSRLEIQVYSGSERLAPTGDSSYTSGGFTYPQHTFRIEWFPKTSSPDEETPPQEATI